MLEKAVGAVKADKTKALEMFNKGEGGFKDRDLYPFCGSAADHPSCTADSYHEDGRYQRQDRLCARCGKAESSLRG